MVEPENCPGHKAKNEVHQSISTQSSSSARNGQIVSGMFTSYELPYLVIQWLNNYADGVFSSGYNNNSEHVNSVKFESCFEKIRELTHELSDVFQLLGSFGTSAVSDPSTSFSVSTNQIGNASFKDASSRWSKHSGNQLERVLTSASQYFASDEPRSSYTSGASSFGGEEYQKVADLLNSASLVKKAIERHHGFSSQLEGVNATERMTFRSVLHPPPLFPIARMHQLIQQGISEHERPHPTSMPLNISRDALTKAAISSRKNIECRFIILRKCAHLRQIKRSLETARQTLQTPPQVQLTASSAHPIDHWNMIENGVAESESAYASARRVFAHLSVRASAERSEILSSRKASVLQKNESLDCNKEAKLVLRYHDGPHFAMSPKWRFEAHSTMVREVKNHRISSSSSPDTTQQAPPKTRMNLNILRALQHRSAPVFNLQNSTNLNSCIRKQYLIRRLSGVVTINSHLFYPVYCLRFDRTGKYFVTGADDHLAKLFVMGDSYSSSQARRSCFQRAPLFGATLVCTFRGHTGVITDIDVSLDNAMVATGSEDGDCRVWGLKDGSPIAVLRGHVGGVTMVSFSLTTPYRLVTTAEDGYARVWDVRVAALKRYGRTIGQNHEYAVQQPCDGNEDNEKDHIKLKLDTLDNPSNSFVSSRLDTMSGSLINTASRGLSSPGSRALAEDIPLPPLPVSNSSARGINGGTDPVSSASSSGHNESVQNQMRPFVPAAEGLNNNDEDAEALDEGVQLLAKLSHENTEAKAPQGGGAGMNGTTHGVSTRNRRRSIKVICMARCPYGGHFATGTDDGIVRIWQDFDDTFISCLNDLNTEVAEFVRKSIKQYKDSSAPCVDAFQLLAKLFGHKNAITDLKYSHRGDRLLTASQKEGVVYIWNWDVQNEFDNDTCWKRVNKIVIPLSASTGIKGSTIRSGSNAQASRGTNASAGSVQCDVAVWSSNDLYVITSQSIPKKQSGTSDPFQPLTAVPIVQLSQILQLWDSITGCCLIRIEGAHAAPCNVIMPHPTDPSLMVSAGSDGIAHLWDIFEASCLETWENRLRYGALPDARVKDKLCGFCDGCWRDVGQSLVLTDDCGRLTLIDTSGRRNISPLPKAPSWMEEQYFASDYYELTYDSHGYALDSRSNLPPHIAPRAVRCNHLGVSIDDGTNYALSGLTGPLPMPLEIVDQNRRDMISGAIELRHQKNIFGDWKEIAYHATAAPSYTIGKVDGAVIAYGPVADSEAALKDDSGMRDGNPRGRNATSSTAVDRRRPARMLSARYNYLEDDGAGSSEGEDDAEEEDFVPSARGEVLLRENGRRLDRGRVAASDGSDSVSLVDSDNSGERQNANQVNRRLQRRQISAVSNRRRSEVGNRGGEVGNSRSDRRNMRHADNRRRRTSSNLNGNADSDALAALPPQPRRNERNSGANFGETLALRRASGRPRAARPARYANSSESEDENTTMEVVSSNRAPASEGDYNGNYFHDIEQGHIWKLASNRKMKRDWLLRLESQSGFSGLKSYAPQVGDSVVYIPRAHYESIRKFPQSYMHTAPWKKFPRDFRWPALLCTVIDVRYRFPMDDPMKKGYTAINAIARLKITGVPKARPKNEFLWSSPEFTRQPSAADVEFDVTLTQIGDASDYLIPEGLYLWRFMSLEAAITLNQYSPAGVGIQVFYECPSGMEDSPLTAYDTKILKLLDDRSRNERQFQQSGFGCIKVSWDDVRESIENISPWDVNSQELPLGDMPEPPRISESVQIALIDKLNAVSHTDKRLKDYFFLPVDRGLYSDYDRMIEVPMDLKTVEKRLKNRYYSTTDSFLADIKLIESNCRKYNDQLADVVHAAEEMTSIFKNAIHDINTEIGNNAEKGETSSTWEVLHQRYMSLNLDDQTLSSHLSLTHATKKDSTLEDGQDQQTSGPSTSRYFMSNDDFAPANQSFLKPSLSLNANHSQRDVVFFEGGSEETHSRRKNRDSLGSDALRPTSRRESGTILLQSSRQASESGQGVLGRSGQQKKVITLSDGSHVLESESEQSGRVKAGSNGVRFGKRKRIQNESEEERSSPSDDSSNKGTTKRRCIPKNLSLSTSGIDLSLSNNNVEHGEGSSSSYQEKDQSTEANHAGTSAGRRTLRLRLRVEPRRANVRQRNIAETSKSDEQSFSSGDNRAGNSSPSDSGEDSEFGASPPGTRKKSARNRAQPTRKVASRRIQRKTYKSDSESYSDNAQSDVSTPPLKRTRRLNQTAKARGRSLRRGRARPNDESDCDAANSSASSEGSDSGSCDSEVESEGKKSSIRLPIVQNWPHISPTSLFLKVCRNVLRKLSDLDTKTLFATPVIKAYPSMKKDYLKKISSPMDFSTIRNKLSAYYSMMDFRNDLILTFKNCIIFNGVDHEFGKYARSLWRQLDSIFQKACEAEGVSPDYIRSPQTK